MFVEVCLLLRIVLNEHQQLIFKHVTVTPCGGLKEPIQDVSPISTLKSNLDYIPTPDAWEVNPKLNSLWMYRPSTYQYNKEQDNEFHQVYLKRPFSVTRLRKPLTLGFDPYFNKGYFDSFERRQKPVTLVAFRRNGIMPNRRVKIDALKSAEVAEMQSPYNEVSSFWENEAGISI